MRLKDSRLITWKFRAPKNSAEQKQHDIYSFILSNGVRLKDSRHYGFEVICNVISWVTNYYYFGSKFQR